MGSAQIQGGLWGSAARDWCEFQEPPSQPLWRAALDAMKVGPGVRFFDAGCGSGGASVLAAERGAIIFGLDAAGALLDIARERVPEGDFRHGDLESLPFPNDAFDAILACNSVQYVAKPVVALAELCRVCSPGGRVAVATWGAPERCEIRVVFETVVKALPARRAGEDPFALSAPGSLESLLEKVGLKTLSTAEVECPFEYSDLETMWRAQRSAGPLQGAIRTIGEAQLKLAVLNATQPFRAASGSVRLSNVFRYVISARKE
jgi:SAM-dependent methyltransferase